MNEIVDIFEPSLEPWNGVSPDKTVAVMMSGGVDSSVTASILLEQGWNVVGVTMKIPSANCNIKSPCCGEEAVFVSKKLGIPHYFLHTEDVFKKYVIEYFRESYFSGKTPNPCIECNRVSKFNILWDTIEQKMGIKHFATGHYAKVIENEKGFFLARGDDCRRDQSYFIYGIERHKLPFFHLPLGEIEKTKVRMLAEEKQLHVAQRPDSQDLCFAGEGDYRNVLGERAKEMPGAVYDVQGNEIARHKGIWNYTIGQRRGLGFALGEPRYVLEINPTTNSIVVGTRSESNRMNMKIIHLNILIAKECIVEQKLKVKIRSLSTLKECIVSEINNGELILKFLTPQFAPTPGQHAVLYNNEDFVVAGGIIDGVW